ncbi:YitT family protein [Anaerobacillus isosaccharinicus]|uniref:YitT family protein n=1 Tax=Anaerobacillus isosaccharinicus TaxID=1532552 RepID=A0A1S2L7F4_9BACI|nr:YitT family protein [Anaerobacillus isosaccharinicus]MBA5586943.1 YitT family protein [Anaerobacillus isosaccharinicus]QOY34852.1 YitT family protein [Anaerobacillus isosaccharinicus]
MQILKKMAFVLIGLFLTSFGVKILSESMLTFGGTAGIATMLTYISTLSWGGLFFLVNLPFFIISLGQLGKWFTISSFMSIIGISVINDSLAIFIPSFQIAPIAAAVLAGFFIGVGVTFVLNNGSSLGGIHILALYLDQKITINRGFVIFLCDSLIILFAVFLVGWQSAIYSILSIVIASFIIGRYKSSPIKAVEVGEETLILNDAVNS